MSMINHTNLTRWLGIKRLLLQKTPPNSPADHSKLSFSTASCRGPSSRGSRNGNLKIKSPWQGLERQRLCKNSHLLSQNQHQFGVKTGWHWLHVAIQPAIESNAQNHQPISLDCALGLNLAKVRHDFLLGLLRFSSYLSNQHSGVNTMQTSNVVNLNLENQTGNTIVYFNLTQAAKLRMESRTCWHM